MLENPQGNGHAEKTDQTVKRMLEKARIELERIRTLVFWNIVTLHRMSIIQHSYWWIDNLYLFYPLLKNNSNQKPFQLRKPMRSGESLSIRKRIISIVDRINFHIWNQEKKVRFQQKGQWTPGYVKNQIHDRLYNIENLDGEVKSNRRDINKSNENSIRRRILENDDLDDISETNIVVPTQTAIHEEKVPNCVQEWSSEPEQPQPYKTRVGREVRRPKRHGLSVNK